VTKLPIHIKILIGLIAGIVWAFVSSFLGWNQFTIDWIDPFGEIFIRILKFIAVPLVMFSIIAGVSSLSDISKLGKMGLKTLLLYILSTVLAVGTGLLLVNTFNPGKFLDENQRIKNRVAYERWVNETPSVPRPKDGKWILNDPAYADQIEEIMDEGELEDLQERANLNMKMKTAEQTKSAGPLRFLVDMVPENVILSISSNKLMLQVIFFAIFFGITLATIPKNRAKPVVKLVLGINEVFLKMVDIIMQAAPYFVFALMAGVIAKMANTPEEVVEIFKGLGTYSLTVIGGLLFLIFVFYPLFASLFVKKLNYRNF